MKPPYVVRSVPVPDPSIAAGLADPGVATVRESRSRSWPPSLGYNNLREVLAKQGVTYADSK